MKKPFGILAVTILLGSSVALLGSGTPAFRIPSCLQDDYGNQYEYLFFNTVNQKVSGFVNNVQCPNDVLSVIGSWTIDKSDQTVLELTIADSTGPAAVCTPEYQLRGKYPTASWHYPDGDGPTFKWSTCSADAIVPPNGGRGGALGPER